MGCTCALMSGVRRLHWNIQPAKAHHAAADADREDDVTRAEHAVVEIVAGGLAQDRAAAPA